MVSMPYIFSSELGGPIWAVVATVYVIVIALAIFVCVDTFRPRRKERFAEMPEPRPLYAVLSGIYLVSVCGVWLPFIPRDWSLFPVLFTPLELAIGTAYLLRVIFPAPRGSWASVMAAVKGPDLTEAPDPRTPPEDSSV
jgi:hypothetical protein